VFSTELIRHLYAHMEWADARVWAAVPDVDGTAIDSQLRDRLLHIHVVQRAFLHVWTNQPVVFPQADEFRTLSALRNWATPYYAEARRFLETLDAARLTEPLALPWAQRFEQRLGAGVATPTLADTCFQVTSHSTHHRGQACTRLRELGAEPPLVDYIGWVWFGRPAAEWTKG
jgi:uncharacterized damage-inducible protein DinB